jgi:prepilin-type processing-associated H-X9-DG protein
VFLDEHPDSINDGYFVNKAYYVEWLDLPSSFHDGAASFSFADGHASLRRWMHAHTRPPSRPYAAELPPYIPKNQLEDFDWVLEKMSVARKTQPY